MRLSESRIRRIIREEVEQAVDEMAYAGDLGVRRSTDQETDSFISSNLSRMGVNRDGAEKYARSGRFKTLAKRHFDNIPYNVWVAPLIGVGHEAGVDDDPEMGNRGRVLDLVPEGIEALERLGFEAPARVGGDDLVILYSAMGVDPNFLATPWMVMHSIFDTNSITDDLIPGFSELNAHLVFGDGGGEYLDESVDDDPLAPIANLTDNYGTTKLIASAMTMASARNNRLSSGGDLLAEMMCQELLTKGGLRVNFESLSDNPEIEGAVRELARRVKRMAADFRRNAQGKLIVTATN
jgi:hypothetical protein